MVTHMAQRLKSWESPRREGRNDKGKGGSARQRQLKKRNQMLRNQLKGGGNSHNANNSTKGEKIISFSPFFNAYSSCPKALILC